MVFRSSRTSRFTVATMFLSMDVDGLSVSKVYKATVQSRYGLVRTSLMDVLRYSITQWVFAARILTARLAGAGLAG